jgi:hypothetical protein
MRLPPRFLQKETHMLAKTLPALIALTLALPANAQLYNDVAGQSAPRAKKKEPLRSKSGKVLRDDKGHIRYHEVEVAPDRDGYGNARGNEYDLARDGAFEGQTVAVLNLCAREVDFSRPQAALSEKGFATFQWKHAAPPVEELRRALKKSTQLWVISDTSPKLSHGHIKVIKEFFDAGHGVYIWGDNDPYYADANVLANALIGASMSGNLMGNQVVGLAPSKGAPGVMPNHLVTTGLEHLYEGITIATLAPHKKLKPLLYGSAENLVAAIYEEKGKRLIIDGGFTRLYNNWDSAGTARYVKNAAAWLVNVERFGEKPGPKVSVRD